MGNILADQERFLLASKIQVPPQKSDLVLRPELNEKLDLLCEPGGKLALVIAPPGFGKTSLVGDWVCTQGLKTAWFSIEESEDYPLIFWQYFVAAIQDVYPQFSNPFVFTSSIPGSKEIHDRLNTLINRISSLDGNLLIVLDDLHHLTNPDILQEVKYLVEHLPANLKLVIISQLEPDWSLVKMKATGSLVEIRSKDLAFSYTEAVELLHKMEVPGIAEAEVKNLVDQSEGWVFGIQLAALAGSEKNNLFYFDPHNRYVNDYLISEVLNILPADIQDFLLEISILENQCADLCAHITGREDAPELLNFFENRNLFLSPVDGQREWYRFHHLFLELLRSKQTGLPDDRITLLHTKASEWFEIHGEVTAAVGHSLKAKEYERTVNLVEKNLFRILDQTELLKQSELVSKLPADIIHNRPELAIANAWLLAYAGKCAEAENFLLTAQESLDRGVSKASQRQLIGKILAVRSYICWLRGENDKTIKNAGQALINLDPEDRMNRSITLISMGEALENAGNTTESLEVFTEAIETCSFELCAHIHIMACAAKIRLMIFICQLQQAEQLAAETIRLVHEKSPDRLGRCAALGNIYAHRAEIYRCWNQLSRALELATEGFAFGKKWGHADTTITTGGIKSAVLWTMGQKDEALAVFDEIRPMAILVSPWYLNYLDSYMILMGINPDHVNSTCKWFNLNVNVEEAEFNHLEALPCRARIRMLYTNKQYADALNWLELASKDAENAGSRLSIADIKVVQAICHFGQGNKETAQKKITEALDLVRAEHAYSIILDKGDVATKMLEEMTFNPPLDVVVDTLLDMAKQRREGIRQLDFPGKKRALPVALSKREMEILGYLATHRSSTEIAESLTVSANTVRFHIKSIYNKLDVHSRDEAVETAIKLGLI